MKKIVALACCALVAPLVFGQTRSNHEGATTTTEQSVTVTGTVITASEDGAAAAVPPAKTVAILVGQGAKPVRLLRHRTRHRRQKRGTLIPSRVSTGDSRLFFSHKGGE